MWRIFFCLMIGVFLVFGIIGCCFGVNQKVVLFWMPLRDSKVVEEREVMVGEKIKIGFEIYNIDKVDSFCFRLYYPDNKFVFNRKCSRFDIEREMNIKELNRNKLIWDTLLTLTLEGDYDVNLECYFEKGRKVKKNEKIRVVSAKEKKLFKEEKGENRITTFKKIFDRSNWGINDSVSIKLGIATPDGGYIIVGSKETSTNFDVYVLRLDSKWDTIWSRVYRREGKDFGNSVAATSDGGCIIVGETYVSDSTYTDVYILKLDSKGDTVWSRVYGGEATDIGYSVVVTPDSGYLVVGETSSFGARGDDIYVLKLDRNGDTLWSRVYRDKGDNCGFSVAVTKDSGFIIGGASFFYKNHGSLFSLLKINSKGDSLWSFSELEKGRDICYSVVATEDGGCIAVGECAYTYIAEKDVYVLKLDRDGKKLWDKVIGKEDGSDNRCGSVFVTSDKGYFLAGNISSSEDGDIYLLKLDSKGDTLWSRKYGDKGSEEICYFGAPAPDGGYVIFGKISSTNNKGILLIKTDADGNVEDL